jgi:hypothetical protein
MYWLRYAHIPDIVSERRWLSLTASLSQTTSEEQKMSKQYTTMKAIGADRPIIIDDAEDVSGGCSYTCGNSCGKGSCTNSCTATGNMQSPPAGN